ncbi:hypothetical protein IU438_06635 [Nocardia cyriacigeorgica]|uniref:hypothetical protein n=1 Tax=Nocardia cyriacigeorgica TaxID=135487 RepID=UPI001895178E|nr:hypothetical protein [Nocardia cyriacigeorgica]MBF6097215.1 hypothetical protein [Nocardia cyriacigeorgica]MBF6160793.1 hypothetical protein [Nocardia cyriacigeorgica]MBF6201623.1 hypothetical protein [Nocardia cyriacigeorgica]MBF6395465.1 hypothetical protein [Nocardia cyriacigeorgica]MBF6401097.1 hypothetical protein [Nocardia cyriacigeorgica]
MSVQDDITLWRSLADQAKAGQLFLDDAVAKSCRSAIDDQIGVYQECIEGIESMARVTGLGEFECGKELARLLGLKAIDPTGDGDLSTALRDHIEVLKLMGDTIQVTLDRLQEQDSANSQGYNGV